MTDIYANRPAEFEDVASFLKLIKSIQDKNRNHRFVYRGHSSLLYEFIPSLFRKEKYIDNESKLMRDLMSNNADDFQDDLTTFDRLVRMQHHGLPTRLLDVTTNALVALYFACSEQKLTKAAVADLAKRRIFNSDPRFADGRIILFRYDSDEMKYFDSLAVSCHANMALLDKDAKNNLKNAHSDFLKTKSTNPAGYNTADLYWAADSYNNNEYVKKLKRLVVQDRPGSDPDMRHFDLTKILLVRPKMTNKRINAQSGLFYIFGIQENILSNNNNFMISTIEICLPHRFKKAILDELDTVGINKRTIYPGIESSATYLTDLLR